MSVTKYYQAANGKVAKVVQSSNNLTPEEEGKLRQSLGNYSLLDKKPSDKQTGEKKIFTPTGRFRGADYETGLNKGLFRADLARLETNEEKRDFLNNKVGKEGWVVDKQGSYLLTPTGRKQFNEKDTENNLLAIDADAKFYNPTTWEGEDWAELGGEIGLPMLAGVGGELGLLKVASKFPKAPILGAIARNPYGLAALGVGSVVWGLSSGIAEIVDEATQKMAGQSRQNLTDEVLSTGTSFGVGNLAGGLILKGLGKALTTGTKGFGKKGKEDLEQSKDFIRKANKKGFVQNVFGPEGINRSLLGGAVNIGSKILNADKARLMSNVDASYDDIMTQVFNLDKNSNLYKKLKEDITVDDFAKYADDILNKQDTSFYKMVKPQADKDIQNSFKYILNDVRKSFTQGRNFDDVVKNSNASNSLFYKMLETSGEAVNADLKKLAINTVDKLKTSNQVEVFGPKQLQESLKKIADSKRLTDAQKKEQSSIIQNVNNNIVGQLGKGTSDIGDDTFVTFLKPSESVLRSNASKAKTPRSDFLKTISNDENFMKDRVSLRLGKDTTGEVNFKVIPTPTLKRTLLEYDVKAETLGAKSNNPYVRLMNSNDNELPSFTPTEMNQILSAINNYQIQSINGKLGVKDSADQLRNAAFADLDNAIIKLTDDAKEIEKIINSAPDGKVNAQAKDVSKQLNENFGHMMDMRQKFKEFKVVTSSSDAMQMLNNIQKNGQSPTAIFAKINESPEFTLDIANAFKALPKPEELFKNKIIPKDLLDKTGKFNVNALSKRQQDAMKTLEDSPYDEAMKKRLAYELSLTEIWPSMMSGASNSKQALDMLSEQWFKNLGLAEGGFDINVFKTNLLKSFELKPVSTKSLLGGKDYTAKELKEITNHQTFMSPIESLLKQNPRSFSQLKELKENLLKYPDELLSKNTNLVNVYDNVIKSGGNKEFSNAINTFNQALKTNQKIAESEAKKIIKNAEKGGFSRDFSKKYFQALNKNDINILKNKFPEEFENVKTSGMISLIKSTKSGDGDFILNPVLLADQLKSIGREKFNFLYGSATNKNPYNNVLDTMEVLTKVNQVDGSGGLIGASMKKALMDNIPSVLAAVGTLGAAGSVFGTGGLAGSLLMYGLLVSMANSPKFARQLTQEIKPLTKGDTLFKMLKDRTVFEKRYIALKGIFVANSELLQNSIEQASSDYDRAKSIYGDDLGFGIESGIPSLSAAQDRLQTIKQSTRDDRLFPAFRAARSRAERIGLPDVAPMQTNFNSDVNRRKALAGGNPDTQAIAERGQR